MAGESGNSIDEIIKQGQNIVWTPDSISSSKEKEVSGYSTSETTSKQIRTDLSRVVDKYKTIEKSINVELNKKISVMDYLSGKIKGETGKDTIKAVLRKMGFSRMVASKGLSGAMEEMVQLISENCKTLEEYIGSLAETANIANEEITNLRGESKNHAITYEKAIGYIKVLDKAKTELEQKLSTLDPKSIAAIEVKQDLDKIRPEYLKTRNTEYSSQRARDRTDNLAEGLTYTSEMILMINDNINELYGVLSSILEEQKAAIRAQTELTKAGDLTLQTVSNYGLYHEKINQIAVANSELLTVFSKYGAEMIENNTYKQETLEAMKNNIAIARENQNKRIEEGRKAPSTPPSQ